MTSGFIWYELMTDDLDSAARFYGAVMGWTVADAGQGDMDYRQFSKNGVNVGGMMALPPAAAEDGMRPGWFGYVNVDDADAAAARIADAGGSIHMPGTDVPGVGRFVFLSDPQGANLYVMTPIGEEGGATSFRPGVPGHGGWHELHTADWRTARDFYTTQFGWSILEEMDLGPGGVYALFNYGAGDAVGGMMMDSGAERPYWLYYFNVEDIDAATARVCEHGGTVLHGPQEVPGGSWVIDGRDPQGGMFALSGPRA